MSIVDMIRYKAIGPYFYAPSCAPLSHWFDSSRKDVIHIFM